MGQAKRRGNLEQRIAAAQELAQVWDEAHAEKWERERPKREALESIRRDGGVVAARANNRLAASLILTAFAAEHRII